MNHPHRHLFRIRVKAGEIRLGSDRGERLQIYRSTVCFVFVGHGISPKGSSGLGPEAHQRSGLASAADPMHGLFSQGHKRRLGPQLSE